MIFRWIDDDDGRVGSSRRIAYRSRGIELHSYFPSELEFEKIKEQLNPKSNPTDLFIVDHFLNQTTKKESGGAISWIPKGSGLTAILRDLFPRVPVVGITAANPLKDISQKERSEYLTLFSDQDPIFKPDRLRALAEDFRRCEFDGRKGFGSQLAELLAVPESDLDLILSVIPQISSERVDADTAFLSSQWVLEQLLRKRGPLVDELGLATMLGLKPAAVRVGRAVRGIFDSAMYSGLFSGVFPARWWAGAVGNIVRQVSGGQYDVTWNLGRRLKGVRPSDYSEDPRGNSDPAPNVVAWIDTSRTEEVQIRETDTKEFPRGSAVLGFEVERVVAYNVEG